MKMANSKNGGGTAVSTLTYCFALIPFMLFFLFLGMFVGSQFVGTNNASSPPLTNGIPGTISILKKWDEVSSPRLRGAPTTEKGPKVPDLPLAQAPATPSKPATTVVDRSSYKEKHESSSVIEKVMADHPITGSELAAVLRASLHADRRAFMKIPTSMDSQNVLIGAWIYLDDLTSENDMRTVFTNKKSGCGNKDDQYGFSVYVNAWQTNDHRLYVEYGGLQSGCHKVDSNGIQLHPKQWYHVSVFLGTAGTVLFIDGSVVGSSTTIEPHMVQSHRPLLVGQYDGGEFAFQGNISHLAVLHCTPSSSAKEELEADIKTRVNQMMHVSAIKDMKDVFALYPLDDASKRVPDSIANEVVGGLHGKYTFPLPGRSVGGVNMELVDGVGGRPVTPEMKEESDALGRDRREKVKAAMQHAWQGYREHAFGHDEVKPISGGYSDTWGGMAVTLIDSLDTLWLMGLKEEFEEARQWVEQSLTFSHAGTVSFFETTIRVLGGLLAAYDLSKEKVFLDKAKELGDLLMPAFETPTGIPRAMVSIPGHRGASGWAGNSAILSELGTLQVEFRYLSHHTGRKDFEKVSMKPMQLMHSKHPANGLFPIKISINDGSFTDNIITFGALGDSFYEYLLKIWLQGGKKETWLREMFDEAMDGVMDVLLQTTSPSGLAFLGDWDGNRIIRKMDHLVCFMPGALALGAVTNPKGADSPKAKRDMAVAKALMYTCREMYHRTSTGIAPEYVEFPPGQDIKVASNVPFYILRPETSESLFVLQQLTGDPIYREWAWEIFQAIDKHCRTSVAYGALKDVRDPNSPVDDRMESFFLAETLKYLFLAQDPDNPVDLAKAVINTEAHPLSILDDSHSPFPG